MRRQTQLQGPSAPGSGAYLPWLAGGRRWVVGNLREERVGFDEPSGSEQKTAAAQAIGCRSRSLPQLGCMIGRFDHLGAGLGGLARRGVSIGHCIPDFGRLRGVGLDLLSRQVQEHQSSLQRIAAAQLVDPAKQVGLDLEPLCTDRQSAALGQTNARHPECPGRLIDLRRLERLDRFASFPLVQQERDTHLDDLTRRWRRGRLDRSGEFFFGLGRFRRSPQQIGFEQIPVTRKTHFRRRLIQQLEGLALSRSSIARCGRIEVRAIRQCLGQAKPQVVSEGGTVPLSGDRAKPLERVVEGLDSSLRGNGSVGTSRLASVQLRPVPNDKPPLETESAVRGRIRVLLEEPIEQLDSLRPMPPPLLGIGRRLRCPVQRARHFECQLFAARQVERRVLDLAPNRRQVPRQLVVVHRHLGGHHGRGDDPRSCESIGPAAQIN